MKYIWDGRQMLYKLKIKEIPEWMIVVCYVLAFVPRAVASLLDRHSEEFITGISAEFISFVIILVGIGICYIIYAGEQKKDFLVKYICLSLPALIRSHVFMMPLILVLSYFVPAFFYERTGVDLRDFHFSYFISHLITIYFYYYVGKMLLRDHVWKYMFNGLVMGKIFL